MCFSLSVIEVKGLYKTFEISRGADIEVLRGINLKVAEKEFVTIMGPSGSGKSTLLNILSSIEEYNQGNVLIDGIDLSKANLIETRRHKTSIIYQDFNLLPYLSAVENVMVPMVLVGVPEAEARVRGMKLLQQVHMEHRAGHSPDDLSGGEQQRTAIARALANNPKVLLADEPTGNLDTKTGDLIINLFKVIIEQGISVVLVTHDLSVAKQTDRILILREGRLHKEEDVLEEI